MNCLINKTIAAQVEHQIIFCIFQQMIREAKVYCSNIFQIEIINMNLQTCRSLCNNCLHASAQAHQERYARQSIQHHHQQQQSTLDSSIGEKDVFSFRLHCHRKFEHSDKNTQQQAATGRIARLRSAEIGMPGVIDTSVRFYSPTIKEQLKQPAEAQASTRRESQNIQSMLSPRIHRQPKVVFQFSTPPSANAQASKMAGKRMRTNEEETEYSSKHSQIIFKSSFQVPESSSWVTFQKGRDERNRVTFHQPSEASLPESKIQGESLRTISEHMPSSQEHSRSPTHIDYYHSGATVQTIVTSTEIKSRHSSKFSNQLQMLKEAREEREPPRLNFDAQGDQNYSISTTPKAYLSPREDYALPNDPTLFQGEARQYLSPRISVLSLSKHNQNQEQEQEQLRDVIDHNFLISQQCSRNNSPKVSLNPSLKNVSDLEHSERQRHLSPLHSRQGSWQLGPLMSTHAKFQRTNTIESIQSFSSEMISCLDIKFMQKNRGRRGVSRLL